jgi:hypothetical protein
VAAGYALGDNRLEVAFDSKLVGVDVTTIMATNDNATHQQRNSVAAETKR